MPTATAVPASSNSIRPLQPRSVSRLVARGPVVRIGPSVRVFGQGVGTIPAAVIGLSAVEAPGAGMPKLVS